MSNINIYCKECLSKDAEIERLRGLVYAVPPTENTAGQTWQEACEANRTEVARLDNLLRTYRLPDEVVDIKVVIELRAEIERLRKALLFYAHPEKVKPSAVWNEDYPGGITYSEGGYVYLDNGDMAREALGE